MSRVVRKFVRAVRAALLWVKALDKAAEGNHADAIACLRSIYDIYGGEIPSAAITYDINMLCGSVAGKLGDFDLSLAATMIALRQLKGHIKGLSDFDKDYLRYHCKITLEYCVFKGERVVISSDLLPIDLDYASLRPERVKGYIKRHFPLARPGDIKLH